MPEHAPAPFIVLSGNAINGLTPHGPFRTSAHALSYAAQFLEEYVIAQLRAPNDEDDGPDEDWSGYGRDGAAAS